MITTVPASPGVVCEAVAARFLHMCPVKDEVDNGALTIGWTTTDVTLELHSLAAYLRSWADAAITHEELCLQIVEDLAWTRVTNVTVSYTGTTAGLLITATGGNYPLPSQPLRG